MSDASMHNASPAGRRQLKPVILEATLVAAAGFILALLANGLSPRGLTLNRNYFPSGSSLTVSAPGTPVSAGLQQRGLQSIDATNAAALFKDPRRQHQLIVFVDARDEEHFLQGHIPGAFELDPYQVGRFLPGTLPACQGAERVIVYCNGGDCEDSEFAALTLRDAGIPNIKLFVFTGGMPEWVRLGMPVERGAQPTNGATGEDRQ